MGLSCERCVDLLGEYAEQALAPEAVEAVEAHLRECPPCAEAFAEYRRIPGLVRRATEASIPPDVRWRLRRLLDLAWHGRRH